MKAPLFIYLSFSILPLLWAKAVDVYFGTGTTPEAIGLYLRDGFWW